MVAFRQMEREVGFMFMGEGGVRRQVKTRGLQMCRFRLAAMMGWASVWDWRLCGASLRGRESWIVSWAFGVDSSCCIYC
jgi:hypothetical protein